MTRHKNNAKLNLGLLPGLGGGFTTMATGGQVERFVQYYLPAYSQAFYQISYFSYHNEQLADFIDRPQLLDKLTLYPKRSSSHYRQYALQMPGHYETAFRACDVLRVFHTPGGIPAWLIKKRRRVPFVTTYGYKYHQFSAIEGNRLNGFLLRFIEPLILRQAAAVIVTTETLRHYVQRWVPSKQVHLIPNGVDTAVFTPKPTSPKPIPTILFVGRLSHQKNLPILIETVSKVKTPFHLRIVGDGPLRDMVTSKAAKAGISCQFDGTRSHHELPAIFQAADLFVLPSRIEGHPKVLIEAMSCGLPCIASDSEGNRALIRDGQNGLLVNMQNSAQFASKIDFILSNPAYAARLGAAARRHVENHFHIHTLIQQEIALLQQVGETKRRSRLSL